MRFTTLTTALMATTAIAAPAPANTATCSLEYTGMFGRYTLEVGRPYLDGKGCKYVKDTIHKQMVMTGFKCKDNGKGGTHLEIKTNVGTKKINKGLQNAYPMIPFVAKNTCDPYNP